MERASTEQTQIGSQRYGTTKNHHHQRGGNQTVGKAIHRTVVQGPVAEYLLCPRERQHTLGYLL